MEKFIRIDTVGQWRGKDHQSNHGLIAETETEWTYKFDPETWEEVPVITEVKLGAMEEGISCYSLKNVGEAIENLRDYWVNNWSWDSVSDYEDKQITIFAGTRNTQKWGLDGEDLAWCEVTIAELPAAPFMEKVFEAYEKFEDGEITEEEYHEMISGLVKQWRR